MYVTSPTDLALAVRGLGKAYTIDHNAGTNGDGGAADDSGTLAGAFLHRLRNPLRRPTHETFWAVRDVSFEVARGEVVGIIGRNGAGKSTLLKILSRITGPTTGRVELYGRVGSLLEVGTGFHRELTGRENIYLNGAILGMTRREIERQFDAIVDFAGTEKLLDTPVKRYSSGMYVRLAFAVAAHLNPEILIVDEVLAVGDAEFQKKCLGKMKEVSGQGRTVLFVSHSMPAVLNLCTRAVLLAGGRVVMDGDVRAVTDRYFSDGQQGDVFQPDRGRRSGDRRAAIENFEIRPAQPETGAPAEFVFEVSRPADDRGTLSADFAVTFSTDSGTKLLQLYSRHMGRDFGLPPGRSRVSVKLDNLPLAPGRYRLNLWLGAGSQPIDFIEDCFLMTVVPGRMAGAGETFVENRGYPIVVPSSWAS